MTDEELTAEVMKLRPVVRSIMRLHDLSEEVLRPASPLQRTIYDAQIYASGVELAHKLFHIMHQIETSKI